MTLSVPRFRNRGLAEPPGGGVTDAGLIPSIDGLVGNSKGELVWAIHDGWGGAALARALGDPLSRSATTFL